MTNKISALEAYKIRAILEDVSINSIKTIDFSSQSQMTFIQSKFIEI